MARGYGRVTRGRALERAEYDPLDPAKQHAPAQAGSLVSSYIDGRVLKGASDASRALVTWRRIAGKRAAKHTVAVWLNRPKKGDGLPELLVYLDGNALMQDLTTNAELFVERLAYAGLGVARVRFRLSRKAGQQAQAQPEAPAAGTAPAADHAVCELPPLTALECARVATAVANLPDELRPSASKAMELSLRRQKSQTTQKATMPPETGHRPL